MIKSWIVIGIFIILHFIVIVFSYRFWALCYFSRRSAQVVTVRLSIIRYYNLVLWSVAFDE